MRKFCHRKVRQVRSDTVAVAVLGSALMPTNDQLARLTVLRPAFDALCEGRADQGQFRAVLGVHNLILALSAMPGVLGGQPRDFCTVSSDTLKEIGRRRLTGSTALETDEQEVVQALLALYAQVIENVALRFIEDAEHRTEKRLARGDGVCNLGKAA